MSEEIKSDGFTLKRNCNGVTETVSSSGFYSANTPDVLKTNSETIQETANQRNVDIRGNS